MLEQAVKLLERFLNTTSMNKIADLEDDVSKFLDEYYKVEDEISDTDRLDWLENRDNYKYIKIAVLDDEDDTDFYTLRDFIDKQIKSK